MEPERIGRNILYARKRIGMSREELAQKAGTTPDSLTRWECGKELPDIENLMLIAEVTNTPYSVLLALGDERAEVEDFLFRDRLFQEENMYTRMKRFAQIEDLSQTSRALGYMRSQHMGQYRKQARRTREQVLYINHPLLMACQAHAMGIRDDRLLAAILLHDVVEDTGVTLEDIPFSDEVRAIVDLVTFRIPEGKTEKEATQIYYQRIAGNPEASVVKIIDRCNNISTMAASFSMERMREYMEETETYVLPLANLLKNHPNYSNVAFLIKYQILSIMETVKYLIVE